MRKSKLFFKLLLGLVVLGCQSTTTRDTSVVLPSKKLEDIILGDDKSSVDKKIGKASEIRESKKDELWIYDSEPAGNQLGTITFDTETQKVKGITLVPDIDSKESKIDFLLKHNFGHLKFDEIFPNRCQKDFFPTSAFYINTSDGVSIRYNRHTQIVESYSKVENTYLYELIKSITNCPK